MDVSVLVVWPDGPVAVGEASMLAAAGCWLLLAAGCWLLAAGCWLLLAS
jgi:hypothetical protein